MVWYSRLLKNFPQFVVIHAAKGFSIVNKAEIPAGLVCGETFLLGLQTSLLTVSSPGLVISARVSLASLPLLIRTAVLLD